MTEGAARLLIIEDDHPTRQLLCDLCTSCGYEVHAVEDGETGLAEARSGRFDLVLLDLMLPVRDGYSLLTDLRATEEGRAVPVIVLTALGDLDGKLKGMELGADDWVSKPFKLAELQARIRAALKIQSDRKKLRLAEEELARLRELDPLTGVGTWPQLKAALDAELARARRHGRPASVLLLSLEGLGEVRYRAPARAEAFLHALLQQSQEHLRGGDRLFRIEPDAFVAVLPESDLEGARRAALRVSEVAEALRVDGHGEPLGVRVVIAGAAFPHSRAQTGEELLREAARCYASLREHHPDALVFWLPKTTAA